jgi:hypothetical protein
VLVQAASFKWRWVAACFALEDTNGDGSIRIDVGRHGEVFGDESRSFLMLRGLEAEPIEQFLDSSPGNRLLAVVKLGRLSLIDADTNERWDLTALGARIPPDGSPALPHPAVRLLADGRVAFVRPGYRRWDLIVFEPRSRFQAAVYSTTDEIARFDFEAGAMQIRTLPKGTVDDSIYTNLARRPCRGQPTSSLTARRGADPTHLHTVRIPPGDGPTEAVEEVLAAYHECTVRGFPALASSADETQHLLASSLDGFSAERGPLRWGRGEVHKNNCAKDATQ